MTGTEMARTLDDLALIVTREFELAERDHNGALAHALACGKALNEAKDTVQHGEWQPWLQQHFPASERTARRWMSFASNPATILDAMTVREAVHAITKPEPKPRESNREFEAVTKGLSGHTIEGTAEEAADEKILAASGRALAIGHDLELAAHLDPESAKPELFELSRRAGSLQVELERLSR